MHGDELLILLVQVAAILAAGRVLGAVARLVGQPHVVGEMIAGIVLGPTFLGWAAPDAWHALFPPDSVRNLGLLSQVGVVLFLFLIGLELDPALLRSRGRAALAISSTSIGAPLLLGAGLGLLAYGRFFAAAADRPHPHAVALFIGAAMSVTAFPVLARILTERKLQRTQVGAMAITCAAISDVIAWCLLAFVVAVATAQGLRKALVTAGLAAAYVAVVFLAVRPFLRRLETLHDRQGGPSHAVTAIVLGLVLLSAAATQWIGIHALFGAFLIGVVMPKGSRFVRDLADRVEDLTVVLLLPIFFAFSGLRTDFGRITAQGSWGWAALIVAVAVVGKFGGTAAAARACGMPWRESSAVGILMNTRGLMELVILNLGRELGVITDELFAMMVLMAVVTTAMTSPALLLAYPPRLAREEGPEAAAAAAREAAFTILVPVSLPKSGGPLLQIADALLGPAGGAGTGADARRRGARLLALHLTRADDREAYRAGLPPADEPVAPEPPAEALAPLLAQAAARGIPVEPLTLPSDDVPADIAATAAARAADLVLMGYHKPVFGKAMLGGTVHRVLAGCPAHVAIFVDRGFRQAGRVLVPYLGSGHDRLALDLASRMARHAGSNVTVLHVVPPMRGNSGRSADARAAVDRAFSDGQARARATLRVVEDDSPVGVVLHQAQQFDLVVIGVAEEWGLESRLFGWRPERIARDCPCSLLIVRRYGGSPL